MADTNFVLKVDGIDGESKLDGHENEIDISSYSLGVTNSGSFADSSTGGGTGKSSFQDAHFTAAICKAYPKLKLACAEGGHIATAVLTCLKAGGGQQEYLSITFTDVLVSSTQLGGSGGDDGITPMMQFSLNFAQIDVKYQSQDEKGAVGNPVQVGYNLSTSKKK